jgi:hypothetical protein
MTTSIQPGWYDDPEDSNGQRYWDGQAWTPHRQGKPVSQPSPPPPPAPQQAPPPSAFPPPPPGQQPQWAPPAGATPRRSLNPLWIVAGAFAVLAIAGAVVFFVFFDKEVLDPKTAEKNLSDAVSQETGDTPTGVSCPDGIDLKVGATFDCHFTLPDGAYTAHCTVTKVDGDKGEFDAKWNRTDGG